MLRLSGGKWKGRKFGTALSSKTRPTAIRAREGLFNVIEHRFGTLQGLRVADLFAGSGALGLEALSRGAAHCCFVESDRAAARALQGVLSGLEVSGPEISGPEISGPEVSGPEESYGLLQTPAENCRFGPVPFDLVFMDPPYGQDVIVRTVQNLVEHQNLTETGMIVVEIDRKDPLPALDTFGLKPVQDRAWGRNRFLFWQYPPPPRRNL